MPKLPHTTLDKIIRDALGWFGDDTGRAYTRALRYAHAFRREYIADGGTELRTAELLVLSDRTAVLPDDYVEWGHLGLQLPGWPCTKNVLYNPRLPAPHAAQVPGPGLAATAPEAPAGFGLLLVPDPHDPATPRWDYVGLPVQGAGVGAGGYGGDFKIDDKDGLIVCSSTVPAGAVLVLEYYTFDAPEGTPTVIDALAHDWGVFRVVAELHRKKENLAMAREFDTKANQEKERFENRTSTFSVATALHMQRLAAAQRYK